MHECEPLSSSRPAAARLPEPAPGNHQEEPVRRFITRLPLLAPDGRIVGYELRVRPQVPLPVLPGATTMAQIQDEALLTAVIDLDYQKALGSKLTLLNLNPSTLANPLLDLLQPERTLLAVPTSVPPQALPVLACLAERGFGLVWDDQPEAEPAHPGSHIRIDLRQHNAMSLGHRVITIRKQGSAQLIAAQVDTQEAYETCRRLGFDLLQGAYYIQPPAERTLHPGRLVIMELLNLVMGHGEIPALEAKFKQDAALSHRLLRYINSPAVGLRYPIRSIGQALVMLGHDQLYRWLTLLLFTHGQNDARSRTLLRHAVVRARLTETLGEQKLSKPERGSLFIAGILSMLDSLLGLPLEQALAGLRLPEAVTDALLGRQGPYAPFLQLAEACEQFDQERIAHLCQAAGLTPDAVNLAHVNALIWSEGLED